MTYTTMKVFDACRPVGNMPTDVYDVSHALNGDLHSNGNDSYFPFEIVAKPNGDDQGGGWVSTRAVILLTDWLKKQGAEVGEIVLVNHWW